LHHIHVNKKGEVEELISCKKTWSNNVNEEKTITYAGHGKEEDISSIFIKTSCTNQQNQEKKKHKTSNNTESKLSFP